MHTAYPPCPRTGGHEPPARLETSLTLPARENRALSAFVHFAAGPAFASGHFFGEQGEDHLLEAIGAGMSRTPKKWLMASGQRRVKRESLTLSHKGRGDKTTPELLLALLCPRRAYFLSKSRRYGVRGPAGKSLVFVPSEPQDFQIRPR